jgi:hypothetical protein
LSMSGAAQRKDTTETLEFEAAADPARQVAGSESALKQAVAERLAAHRSRRTCGRAQEALRGERQRGCVTLWLRAMNKVRVIASF